MNMNKRFTHIFFDLDNTLWDFKINSHLSMKETYTYFDIEKSGIHFDRFYACYSECNEQLWAAYRKKEIKKKDLIRRRFQQTFETLGLNGVDPGKMNDHYLEIMPEQKELVHGAIEVLEYLKQKQYKLYVITNGFKEVQRRKLQSSGLAPYFDKVFISEEIKCPKPGKGIFEHAIKSTNARKSKSLMIGDDWDVDFLGAFSFGIKAICFLPHKNANEIQKLLESMGLHKDSYITSLLELKAIL